MEKTRVLISGLGGIAQIAHLPILSKMADVEITGVCDIDKSKAKSIAQKYGVKNYFQKIDDMLSSCPADCLVVTSPTNFHKEQAVKGFEYGLNVLVEKPVARTYSEAAAITDAANKNKKILMVGMNNRFRPDIMMQESFASAGELGEIFYIKTGFLKKRSTVETWALVKEQSGGGVFMDLGIVMLDIALWLLKYPKAKTVTAVNYHHFFKDVEDSSFVLIRLENGAAISIDASWTLHREDDLFYCNIYGREGSAQINPLKIYKRMHGTLVNVTPLKMERPANVFKRAYEYEVSHFINSVRTGATNLSNGREAMERMKIVDAVYKSAKMGKEVSLK